jgi:hypothetical protein
LFYGGISEGGSEMNEIGMPLEMFARKRLALPLEAT